MMFTEVMYLVPPSGTLVNAHIMVTYTKDNASEVYVPVLHIKNKNKKDTTTKQ